ncbi:cytochrome P450 [Streptomyces sp. NPDC048659]|uniref:cytochrome P450 n=1 Tax=Streptomyces sp. NPDC048659 TaxID=3155489 RepID=UPI0034463CAF
MVDLIEGLAYPLPLRVICELVGVPDHVLEAIRRLMNAVVGTPESPEHGEFIQQQVPEVAAALLDHVRDHPGENLTSDLLRAREAGGDVTDDELMSTLMLVIGAGFETTVNLVGNAVVALLRDPAQLAAVRAGTVDWDDVIEETLRVHPPLAAVPLRFAVEDLQVGGLTIPAGDAILTTYGAAGWDPERHGPDAHAFDAARDGDDHLAFGVGVHRRIGAPLARMEARTVLPALFARFPRMTLATGPDELRQVASFIAMGWREIPVRLHGDRAPDAGSSS